MLGLALYLLPDAWQIRLLSLLSAVDYPGGPGVLRFLDVYKRQPSGS